MSAFSVCRDLEHRPACARPSSMCQLKECTSLCSHSAHLTLRDTPLTECTCTYATCTALLTLLTDDSYPQTPSTVQRTLNKRFLPCKSSSQMQDWRRILPESLRQPSGFLLPTVDPSRRTVPGMCTSSIDF